MTAPDVTVPTVLVGGVGAPRGSDYAVLSRQIRAAGLLARRPGAYAVHSGVTLAFYLATCAAVVWVGDSWYQMIVAAVLGVAFTQVAFLAHDGGHQQIFTVGGVSCECLPAPGRA